MTSLLFASKIGAIGAKALGGATLVKAAPIVVPVVCVVACVGVTVAGARYLAKKLPIPADVIADECEHCSGDDLGTDDEE